MRQAVDLANPKDNLRKLKLKRAQKQGMSESKEERYEPRYQVFILCPKLSDLPKESERARWERMKRKVNRRAYYCFPYYRFYPLLVEMTILPPHLTCIYGTAALVTRSFVSVGRTSTGLFPVISNPKI
ncbi:hypothetical protein DY000_02051708 [Brassica cretica]|uniref:Uncharacterized protein n=1 Tax=Brassica cretica TaxID=69181 RepID=A0ABQ7F4H7_BRACR|nr:hypothetical protein DY000_02051708 [Brassica cretica]